MKIKELNDEELEEQIELFQDRIETLSEYISDESDGLTREGMIDLLYRYKGALSALFKERSLRASLLNISSQINPKNMENNIILILKQSINDLVKKNKGITTSDLDAEIINLASYIYLKDSDEINFTLDYLDQEILSSFESYNFDIVDEIIDGTSLLYPSNFDESHNTNAKQGVRMNIQLADNYCSFLKSYFISKHKISDSDLFQNFSSPRNSLWRNGVKQIDSPTQRDINYKFDFESNSFEVLVNPYNPLVTGNIISRNTDKIMCFSYDGTRKFEFLFHKGQLIEVVMHRVDKGDTVKYHEC